MIVGDLALLSIDGPSADWLASFWRGSWSRGQWRGWQQREGNSGNGMGTAAAAQQGWAKQQRLNSLFYTFMYMLKCSLMVLWCSGSAPLSVLQVQALDPPTLWCCIASSFHATVSGLQSVTVILILKKATCCMFDEMLLPFCYWSGIPFKAPPQIHIWGRQSTRAPVIWTLSF